MKKEEFYFFSIINGFNLPLKDEHKHFLEKSLIPLHKVCYMVSVLIFLFR
jgi:hypothetical protein